MLIVNDLRCQSTDSPLGIDDAQPLFSWRVEGGLNGSAQSAYRILVSSSQEVLSQDRGDCWDSGRVDAVRSCGVRYGGKPLVSRTRYYWKVCLWDETGKMIGFSKPTWFETAFLDPSDWKAEWIGVAGGRAGAARYFRCAFEIPTDVVRARLYITGIGYCEGFVNGTRLGNALLDPAYTDYSHRVLYNTFDVGDLLCAGKNVLAAVVACGWHGQPLLKAQLEVILEDGTVQVIASNREKYAPDWMVASGPVVEASIFDGEHYDARLELKGWNRNVPEEVLNRGLDRQTAWTQVFAMRGPQGILQAQALEPIRAVRELDAVDICEVKPGVHVIDFGQNHAGLVRLRVRGTRGDRIVLRYAELLREDGTVNQDNLRTAASTDSYILNGEGIEEWSPSFTYHGYRYVQVEGWPGEPGPRDIVSLVVRSSMDSRADFSSSIPLLNRISEMVRWTEESNLHGLPTDCPQRNERMGWLNDMAARSEELVYNFNVERFLRKFLVDIEDAQDSETGALSDTVPYHWGRQPADPVSVCFLLIPWLLYQHFNDTDVLERHRVGMRRWVEYLRSRAEDGILTYSYYGDWAPPQGESVGGSIGNGAISAHTPGDLISTAYYYYTVNLYATICGVLQRIDEQDRYDALAKRIREAFHLRYWDEDLSGYGSGNQACNAIALYLDLVPAPLIERVVASLVDDVQTHGCHLTTGNLCTKYLLEVLSEHGHEQLALNISTQETYPSWGYMLSCGATTLWERWEMLTGGGMNSHNHPMMGSVGAWLYRRVAGIMIDDTRQPTERKRFILKPMTVDGLDHARAALQTPWGKLAFSWKRLRNEIQLEAVVPWNCCALLKLADGSEMELTSGVHSLRSSLMAELEC